MATQVRRARHRRGQGLSELVLVVSIVAIASISVITTFGDEVRGIFGDSSDALAGVGSEAGGGGGGEGLPPIGGGAEQPPAQNPGKEFNNKRAFNQGRQKGNRPRPPPGGFGVY